MFKHILSIRNQNMEKQLSNELNGLPDILLLTCVYFDSEYIIDTEQREGEWERKIYSAVCESVSI